MFAKANMGAEPPQTTAHTEGGQHGAAESIRELDGEAQNAGRIRSHSEASTEVCTLCTRSSGMETASGTPGTRGTDRDGIEVDHRSPSHSLFPSHERGKRNKAQSSENHSSLRVNTQNSIHGVVYLGHIPSGFSEPQMLRFFSQFGDVVGVELRRSRKTGQSKGYGYIAFDVPEVAEIVAETMNNYMMFGRTLVCEVVPPNLVPPSLFKNSRKKFRRLSTRVRAVQQHNKPDNALPSPRQVKRRLDKERIITKQLRQLGLEEITPSSIGTVLNNVVKAANPSKESCQTVSKLKERQRKTLNASSYVCRGRGKTVLHIKRCTPHC